MREKSGKRGSERAAKLDPLDSPNPSRFAATGRREALARGLLSPDLIDGGREPIGRGRVDSQGRP